MNKHKILLIIIVMILITIIVFSVIRKKTTLLVSPVFKQDIAKQSSPTPSISSYNPPPEVKYDSSTDLVQELEAVNPEVEASDFESL